MACEQIILSIIVISLGFKRSRSLVDDVVNFTTRSIWNFGILVRYRRWRGKHFFKIHSLSKYKWTNEVLCDFDLIVHLYLIHWDFSRRKTLQSTQFICTKTMFHLDMGIRYYTEQQNNAKQYLIYQMDFNIFFFQKYWE